MGSTESRLEQLGDRSLLAVETVLEQSDDGDAIAWADVQDELTTGQWGRLIQNDVLEETDAGYVLFDRETVVEYVDAEKSNSTDETDQESNTAENNDQDVDYDIDVDSKWSSWDKLAAGLAGVFALGYSVDIVNTAILSVLDPVLDPLLSVSSMPVVIFILGTVTATWSGLARMRRMDTEAVEKIQTVMNEARPDLSERKENPDAESDMPQEEMLKLQLSMFKSQFRPMGWISVATIPLFIWMYTKLGFRGAATVTGLEPMVMPIIGTIQPTAGLVTVPLVGFTIPAWLFWYFIASVTLTQVINKMFSIR